MIRVASYSFNATKKKVFKDKGREYNYRRVQGKYNRGYPVFKYGALSFPGTPVGVTWNYPFIYCVYH